MLSQIVTSPSSRKCAIFYFRSRSISTRCLSVIEDLSNANYVSALAKKCTKASFPQLRQKRTMGTLEESIEASQAYKKSCYMAINFTIDEERTVYEAVQRFSAYNIGCLVTTDSTGRITGVISERDYINKIALLGRQSKETLIKEISTKSARLITARPTDTVDACMNKMLSRDIRHLPLIDDDGNVLGLLSVKDLVKSLVEEKERQMKTLSDFALGKGGHFAVD